MPQSTKMLIFDDKGVKKMYQLDPQSNHYKQIGEKGQQQSYDETYLQTLTNLKLKFSSETKQIQEHWDICSMSDIRLQTAAAILPWPQPDPRPCSVTRLLP